MTELTFRQCARCGYESDELDEFVKGPAKNYKYNRKPLCKWCANHDLGAKLRRNESVSPKIDIIDAMKAKPCADCGKTYPACVMDFHHIDPSKKEANVSKLARAHYPMEVFLEELNKCVVLCANCHRLRHG